MSESPQPPAAAPAQDVWTVRRVLEWTTGHLTKHGSDTPRLDAEILLAHARKCRRIQLYTAYDEPLSDAVRAHMKELVKRRAAREPVAYLVGFREFFSLEFRVTSDVLIPRPDTETLVMEAVTVAKTRTAPAVLDLCTGSGCVGVAIAKSVPGATVTTVDLSPAALAIAAENAAKHGVSDRVRCLEGDLFAPLPPDQRFDLIVSNPPYVRTDELAGLDADVRMYEPRLALDGGVDGLDLVRRIIADAPAWLNPGGWLMLEIDPEQFTQGDAIAGAVPAFAETARSKDLAGRWRVWRGRVR
ncbi:MAG: protein-(glutamine-N5) methyltransferase, release factor-specific [Planctomycetales bacterium 12-60-4]|nr:MAG: protein-(glutamine-N5) methyltransferase, release factor-specific [Planctomycetales bacterium 12-60-4]